MMLASRIGYPFALTLVFFILFSTGMASIMYEVVLLSFITTLVGITEFSAGMVIGGFLGGLGLGAVAGGWYSRRGLPLLLLLAIVEILIALYGFSFFALAETFGVYSYGPAAMFVFIVCALLFPAFLMGLEIPVAVEWLEQYRLDSAGMHVGIVYAGDTLGGVLGALVAGTMLVPIMGLEGTMAVGGVLNATTVFLIVALAGRRLFGIALASITLIGSSWVLAVSQEYFAEANLSFFRLVTGYEVVEAVHTPFQYVAIIDHPQFGLSLYFSDQLFKGTGSRQLHELTVLPALNAHPDAQSALVIGGGDGGTVYQLVRAGVSRVVHVDIDKKLVELAHTYLTDVNGGVFDDSRVEQNFMDGRSFLEKTDERFDVIIVDVPPPRRAQFNHIWTKEFYELAKNRLKPGGIFVMHMPGTVYLEAQAIIVNTVRSVFSHAHRYTFGNIGTDTGAIQTKVIASDAYDPRIIRRQEPLEGDNWYMSERHEDLFAMSPFESRFFDSFQNVISTDRNPTLFQFLQPAYIHRVIRELEYESGLWPSETETYER